LSLKLQQTLLQMLRQQKQRKLLLSKEAGAPFVLQLLNCFLRFQSLLQL